MDKKFAQAFLAIPAIGVLFFTVMPIIFMILLAFTNYSLPDHIPPAKLVNWVGLQTFRDLVQLKSWSHTFYGVLTWTIIWAILSTVTTYFGGFLVALLVQQKDIRFKAFWRTIFIIPSVFILFRTRAAPLVDRSVLGESNRHYCQHVGRNSRFYDSNYGCAYYHLQ